MDFFTKLFRPEDFERLVASYVLAEEEGIDLGPRIDLDLELLRIFMEHWVHRIDSIIKLDRTTHSGEHTAYTAMASRSRGYTFLEYGALHNKEIDEASFPFYPVFGQLRRKEGGINFEKQRFYFLTQYTYDLESYCQILSDNGFQPLMDFFLTGIGKRNRLGAILPYDMLLKHLYIGAPTGWGKSVLLRTIFYHLQKRYTKHSLVLIDPHGDLAEAVYRSKLNIDHDRVLYIDPFFKDNCTPTFNPFQLNDRSMQNIVHVVEQNILAFEELLSREGGKVTEAMVDMLEKSLYFLLSRPDSNILDLYNLLNAEETILAEAVAHNTFFNLPYSKPNNRTREGLLFRIGRMLNSPVLRNLLIGKNTFNLEAAINSNKVVIFNLGGLGEMTSVTFGKLLVASLKSMVRKRPKGGPKHTFLMVDEAHSFVTGSFEYLLSQLRGFGLHGIFATQYIEQLGDQARSVKENSAIKILANEDADTLKKMITPPKDIKLNKYEFLLKVRHKTILKFKSPDMLLKHPKKYELNEEEKILLDAYQLKHYYKPTSERTIDHTDTHEDHTVDTVNNRADVLLSKPSLKPPFSLTIKESDDHDA